jgi:hypothetical protein
VTDLTKEQVTKLAQIGVDVTKALFEELKDEVSI